MSECILRQEMSSAILLSIILIHCELMPGGKLIKNEQKKRASICLIFDCLHVWSVQDRAEELLVTLRITAVGIVCDGRCPNNLECSTIVDYHCNEFQYIDRHKHAVVVAGFESECTLNHFVREMNVPPESQGDGKSSAPSNELSPIVVAKGI